MSINPEQLAISASLVDSFIDMRRPHLSSDERARFEMIHGTIDAPFAFDELPLTPTPLDPERLVYERVVRYEEAALQLMIGRLATRIEETDARVTEAQRDAMIAAISEEHSMRILQNARTMNRIQLAFLRNPDQFDQHAIEAIYRARKAEASTLDIVRTIALNSPDALGPAGEELSIEETKLTAPLHIEKIREGEALMYERLEQAAAEDSDFSVEILSKSEQESTRRIVSLGYLAARGNLATKKTIARASYRGVDLVYKERQAMFAFMPTQDLGSVADRTKIIHRDGRPIPLNLQPEGFSTYWSLVNRTAVDSADDEHEMGIYIPSGTSRSAIEAAARMGSLRRPSSIE